MKLGPLSDAKVLGVVFDMFTTAMAIIPSKTNTTSMEIQTTGSRISLYRSGVHQGLVYFDFCPKKVYWLDLSRDFFGR